MSKNLFRRMADSFVEARSRQAMRTVHAHLATLDDATIRSLDMDPSEVRARAGSRLGSRFG